MAWNSPLPTYTHKIMKLASNLVNPTNRNLIYLDQVIVPLVTFVKLYSQETRMSHLCLYVPKLIF